MDNQVLNFSCDYLEGAHESIIRKLEETNALQLAGYGLDPISESAKNKIRKAANVPHARIDFLVGGTQANATVIDALLRSYQGVVAASSGHINVHEAGIIETAGHKVLTIPQVNGKLTAEGLADYMETFLHDGNRDHMVWPGMVYISQPSEYGTIYSLKELTALSETCHKYHLPLYLDGARLAYALGSPENDVTLPDLGRLCDVFYIGGTKCGALIGEAVVMPNPDLIPHFFTIIKQHGALLAKGRIAAVQFDALFENDLYLSIGKQAVAYAGEIEKAWTDRGGKLFFRSPTNQVFFVVDDQTMEKLGQHVLFSYWEKIDETHIAIRLATSWATKREDVDRLINVIRHLDD